LLDLGRAQADVTGFRQKPDGTYVDLDKMIAARKAGASPWELHEWAHFGEFAPVQPYDPRDCFRSSRSRRRGMCR